MDKNHLESFKNPGAIYRGAPFWAWNNKLDKDQLIRQIDVFKEMGLGGFHMHPRTGMDTVYMGEEYMEMIKACRDHAEKTDMLAWLYDEDRWPSGAAGGLVTENEEFRARHLLFTPNPYKKDDENISSESHGASNSRRSENGILLARYEILLEEGVLSSYRVLKDGEKAVSNAIVWYAYLETALPSSWFNNQTYVDTLNPKAMQKFIEVTHEAYYKEIGESFGKSVPAIFTDEPQFNSKSSLNRSNDLVNLILPWTPDLSDSFKEEYGEDILHFLPEIFWELQEGQASVWRYRYHDHVCERFTQAFSDQIGDWCEQHNIALTGHMMEEPTLASQTNKLGESMRGYRSFQIPGIDVLCDRMEVEYSTAKQAQSAAHQYGRSGVLSELYGVTNWHFDFAGHKRQGDWQAALGIVYRVHHLSFVSMAGEAKRDYPASINYQSPWYKEYPVVEDHFARVNYALTKGKPLVNIGVIHPIESYWLACGPKEQTQVERDERDTNFSNIIRWLLYGFLDFDFISESLLPTQNNETHKEGFAVGEMVYDVIVVPGLRTIRSTTLDRLETFVKSGGRVIFAGEIPSLVDAQKSNRAQALAKECECIPYSQSRIISSLQNVAEVFLKDRRGVQVNGCLYQLRENNDSRTLFICNTHLSNSVKNLNLEISGHWQVERLNTHTGLSEVLAVNYDGKKTVLNFELKAHGSELLSLKPGKKEEGVAIVEPPHKVIGHLKGPMPVELSEPNVLLLDKAEYKIGEGEWQSARHLLELDPIIRDTLGLPPVNGMMAQPWTDQKPVNHAAYVHLRFSINSKINVEVVELGLENAENTRIILNGREVEKNIEGYFCDEAIQKVCLPSIKSGENTLELIIDYNRKTYIEWCYLLGDFGVVVLGEKCTITEPVRELSFGDWTHQGLPFYAGNVTYKCSFPSSEDNVSIRIPHFEGPLVKVIKEGEEFPLAFDPFRAEIGSVSSGDNIGIIVFGNRVNTFGQIHSTVAKGTFWYGPPSWRTQGDSWSDEYQLRPMGILTAPVLENK